MKRYELIIGDGIVEVRESQTGKWADFDEVAEAISIAIEELSIVEREISVPSKALPLLRAALGKADEQS